MSYKSVVYSEFPVLLPIRPSLARGGKFLTPPPPAPPSPPPRGNLLETFGQTSGKLSRRVEDTETLLEQQGIHIYHQTRDSVASSFFCQRWIPHGSRVMRGLCFFLARPLQQFACVLEGGERELPQLLEQQKMCCDCPLLPVLPCLGEGDQWFVSQALHQRRLATMTLRHHHVFVCDACTYLSDQHSLTSFPLSLSWFCVFLAVILSSFIRAHTKGVMQPHAS